MFVLQQTAEKTHSYLSTKAKINENMYEKCMGGFPFEVKLVFKGLHYFPRIVLRIIKASESYGMVKQMEELLTNIVYYHQALY